MSTLIQNEYIGVKEGDFIYLTEKGADCIWGDDKVIPLIYLEKNIYDESRTKDQIFQNLWDLIGPQDESLLYTKGSIFYKTILPYLKDGGYPPSYNDYIEFLNNNKKNTSRIKWYRELFLQLDSNDIQGFLRDLSVRINSEINNLFNTLPLEESDLWSGIEEPCIREEEKNNKIKSLIPKVLISYAWENDDPEYMEWIQRLAKDLRLNGIDAQIDQYQEPGTDLVKFMRDCIRTSNKILCIITPKYKEKAESGKGGAAYEGGIISHEIYNNQDTTKFIPILRKGTFEESIPDFLSGRKGFNCINEENYSQELPNIIKAIKQEPIIAIPPIMA